MVDTVTQSRVVYVWSGEKYVIQRDCAPTARDLSGPFPRDKAADRPQDFMSGAPPPMHMHHADMVALCGCVASVCSILCAITAWLCCRHTAARSRAELTSPLLINAPAATSTLTSVDPPSVAALPTAWASFCHSWVVLLLYSLAALEAIALPFASPSPELSHAVLTRLTLLRAGGHLCLGVACEIEFRAARRVGDDFTRLLWRLRAMIRLIAALFLAYLADGAVPRSCETAHTLDRRGRPLCCRGY